MSACSDRGFSLPLGKTIYLGRLRHGTPLLERMNALDIQPHQRKRAMSYRKREEYCKDFCEEDEIRPRTSSMPTRSTFRRPHLQHTHLGLHLDPECLDTYRVRSFEMNAKGKIISRSESLRSRSSNSIFSSESDLYPLSRSSSSLSKDSVHTVGGIFTSKVIILGCPTVGKTALAQQFMTSEYLGGFNTSTDGETEKTVNVLLNGEETALAFVEQAEEDFDDDINDTVAAYLIVYACDDRASFDRAVDTLYNLRKKQHREDVIFFVGNKSDLVRSRCVTAEEAKAVAVTYDCKFVETSVVLNVKVDELLVGIVKQLRIRSSESTGDKSAGCSSSSKSLLNKIFRKENLSKSCENLYS